MNYDIHTFQTKEGKWGARVTWGETNLWNAEAMFSLHLVLLRAMEHITSVDAKRAWNQNSEDDNA